LLSEVSFRINIHASGIEKISALDQRNFTYVDNNNESEQIEEKILNSRPNSENEVLLSTIGIYVFIFKIKTLKSPFFDLTKLFNRTSYTEFPGVSLTKL
jgi:hypothetical protein